MAITIVHDAQNYVFNLDSTRLNAVDFREAGSTLAAPKTMSLRRVYPKRAGDYIGNARNYIKLSYGVTTEDELTPIIAEVSFSRRADVSAEDFAIARGIVAEAIKDSELDSFFSTLGLPS
jgi:hypothetical protein